MGDPSPRMGGQTGRGSAGPAEVPPASVFFNPREAELRSAALPSSSRISARRRDRSSEPERAPRRERSEPACGRGRAGSCMPRGRARNHQRRSPSPSSYSESTSSEDGSVQSVTSNGPRRPTNHRMIRLKEFTGEGKYTYDHFVGMIEVQRICI